MGKNDRLYDFFYVQKGGGAYNGGSNPNQFGGKRKQFGGTAYNGGIDPNQFGGAISRPVRKSILGAVPAGFVSPLISGDNNPRRDRGKNKNKKEWLEWLRRPSAPARQAAPRAGSAPEWLRRPSRAGGNGGRKRGYVPPQSDDFTNDSLQATMARLKTVRRGSKRPNYHKAVNGWYLHGDGFGSPREGRRAAVLRLYIAQGLRDFKSGKKDGNGNLIGADDTIPNRRKGVARAVPMTPAAVPMTPAGPRRSKRGRRPKVMWP